MSSTLDDFPIRPEVSDEGSFIKQLAKKHAGAVYKSVYILYNAIVAVKTATYNV